jgi:hypothetical protein
MTAMEAIPGRSSQAAFHPIALNPIEFAEIGKKRFEEFVNLQIQLLDTFQETNRQWFDRAKSEADLASEFASKLSAARSLPEAMTACQQYSGRRFEMMAEDGKHLIEDGQKFIEMGARLFSNGWSAKGTGVSSS